MARLIILIAVLAIILIVWHKIKKADPAERKKLIFWSILGGVGALLVILAVTGHLNIITAAIAGLIALLPRAAHLLKYLPFVSRLFQQHKNGQQHTSSPPPASDTEMSIEKAMNVLALQPGHSKDDVIQAHRRMMQKLHPDRGGSEFLASQINTAKDVLLKNLA